MTTSARRTRRSGCLLLALGFFGVLVAAGWLLYGGFGGLISDFGRGRFAITVEPVPEARVAETVSLHLVMENFEDREIDGMLYVDLDRGLYEGLRPIRSQPAWVYVFDDDVQRRHKLSFALELTPGRNSYRIELEAKSPGRWQGELEYYRTTRRHPVGPPVVVAVSVVE